MGESKFQVKDDHLDRDDGVTRRSALAQMGAAGCAGTLVASGTLSAATTSDEISLQQWQRWIGNSFELRGSSFEPVGIDCQSLSLRLEEVSDLRQTDSGACFRVWPVALAFSIDNQVRLPSASYQIANKELGEISLFLNEFPVDVGKGKFLYEAILN